MESEACLNVDRFSVADIDRLIEIAEAAELSHWSRQGFLDHLKDKSTLSIALVSEDLIVGYLVARLVPGTNENPDVELLNLAVCEPRQRGGGGTILMENLLSWCAEHNVAKVWLEVRESNLTAQKFYQRFRFYQIGRRKGFYSMPSEDALIMCLELKN
jgi:[ribosomal protein S18]-alanine N-acetyltransferase